MINCRYVARCSVLTPETSGERSRVDLDPARLCGWILGFVTLGVVSSALAVWAAPGSHRCAGRACRTEGRGLKGDKGYVDMTFAYFTSYWPSLPKYVFKVVIVGGSTITFPLLSQFSGI